MDLQEQLALLDAGQNNSTFRKAGDNPLVEEFLKMNSDRPPLNINVDLDQDQVKAVGGDYSTPLFGGELNVGGSYTLPSSIEDPFMGGEMQVPGNTQLSAGWKNKNIGLNVNYGTGGPSVQSQFGASF